MMLLQTGLVSRAVGRTGLVGFPGSGNTWVLYIVQCSYYLTPPAQVRLLVEAASGHPTQAVSPPSAGPHQVSGQ